MGDNNDRIDREGKAERAGSARKMAASARFPDV
jgi:hypothetical protein